MCDPCEILNTVIICVHVRVWRSCMLDMCVMKYCVRVWGRRYQYPEFQGLVSGRERIKVTGCDNKEGWVS